MTDKHDTPDTHGIANQNFVLGEINAVVKSLPSRMDKFEAQTTAAFADLRRDFQANMTGLNSRLTEVEKQQAQDRGVRATFLWLVGLFATGCSGLIGYLFFRR